MSYTQGYEDGVRATKAEYLKLLKEENLHPVKELTDAELYELLPVNLRADEEDAFIFAKAILRKVQEK